MKNLPIIAFCIILIQACSSSDSIFILSPSQSMSITGKGRGQDAATNPYSDGKSIAIVKNLGKNNFNVRIENNGDIIKDIVLKPREKREIPLEKGYELYFDSELESKARIDFRNYDN